MATVHPLVCSRTCAVQMHTGSSGFFIYARSCVLLFAFDHLRAHVGKGGGVKEGEEAVSKKEREGGSYGGSEGGSIVLD